MRQGGVTPAFSSQVDDKSGRIDIVITRPGDKTGASTSGLLAALLIEPIDRRHRLARAVRVGLRSRRRRGVAAVPAGGTDGAVMAGDSAEGTPRAVAKSGPMARGFTFIELLVVTTIVLILASAIQPLARITIQRTREAELRRVLREVRTAIDKFKDAADTGHDSDDRAQGQQRRVSAGPADAGRWRVGGQRRDRAQAEVPAPRPGRPDHRRR